MAKLILNTDSAANAVTLQAKSTVKVAFDLPAESPSKTPRKVKHKSDPVPRHHSGRDTFHTVTVEEVCKPVTDLREQWDLEELGKITRAKKIAAVEILKTKATYG